MKKIISQLLTLLRQFATAVAILAIAIGAMALIARVCAPSNAEQQYPPGTSPAPPFAYRAEDWFGYLRQHRDIPGKFYNVAADEHGLVRIRYAAVLELEHITGDRPEEFDFVKVDENGVCRKFDFAQDKYVRYEE